METIYITDEGHEMNIDDYIQYVKFKVSDLISEDYSDDEVIGFDANNYWHFYSRIFLDKNHTMKHYIVKKQQYHSR